MYNFSEYLLENPLRYTGDMSNLGVSVQALSVMLSPHTFLLALKRDVKKSRKIYIKSSAQTANYCIVFNNVIVNFFSHNILKNSTQNIVLYY